MDYKKLYLELFNKITDVIEQFKDVQIKMEQVIISDESNTEEE